MCNSINNQISTKSITELKGLCQLLFNLLASPHLTKQEAKQIISKLASLKAELSNRFDM